MKPSNFNQVIATFLAEHLKEIEEMVTVAVIKILKQRHFELLQIIKEKATQGIQGEKGEQGIQGEKGVQGNQGEKGNDGTNGFAGKNGINGSPDTHLQIKEKLIQLPVKERWFDERHILNLEELIKRMIGNEPSFGGITRGGMETVKSELLAPTASGANITLNLTQLSTSWSRIIGVYRQGQKLTPESASGWTRSSNTLTVYNATTDEDFIVDYAS